MMSPRTRKVVEQRIIDDDNSAVMELFVAATGTLTTGCYNVVVVSTEHLTSYILSLNLVST